MLLISRALHRGEDTCHSAKSGLRYARPSQTRRKGIEIFRVCRFIPYIHINAAVGYSRSALALERIQQAPPLLTMHYDTFILLITPLLHLIVSSIAINFVLLAQQRYSILPSSMFFYRFLLNNVWVAPQISCDMPGCGMVSLSLFDRRVGSTEFCIRYSIFRHFEFLPFLGPRRHVHVDLDYNSLV